MSKFDVRLDDACDFLDALAYESIDLVITDPAYESLEKHRAIGTTTRLKKSDASSNEWFPIFRNDRFLDLFELLWEAMKPNTHLYMFCDKDTMFYVKPIAEKVGFDLGNVLVWDKVSIGMGYNYRMRKEFILFFKKGKRKLNDLSIPDIITAKRVHGGYPTQKTLHAITPLILQSSEPGEVVVDPFTGSGSTGVAALRQDRDFVGVDIMSSAVELSIRRLKEVGGEHETGFRPPSIHNQQRLF